MAADTADGWHRQEKCSGMCSLNLELAALVQAVVCLPGIPQQPSYLQDVIHFSQYIYVLQLLEALYFKLNTTPSAYDTM